MNPGMYVEAECDIETTANNYKSSQTDKYKFLAPALIEKVSNKLLIKVLEGNMEPFWVEPTSNRIHPCGYWNYVNEIKLKPSNAKAYRNIIEFRAPKNMQNPNANENSNFDWDSFFNRKEMQSALPVSFNLFCEEQTDGMTSAYSPKLTEKKSTLGHLNCQLVYNPRFIWTNLRKLSENDVTSIYRETGIITFRDDTKKRFKLAPSALVLLPKQIDPNFVIYPNVNYINNLCNLNVTCTHREEIKILVGDGHFMSINYPHLIQADCLDLIERKLKLNLRYLIDIFLTCYDLGYSLVSI
jgi:hypothetical protein